MEKGPRRNPDYREQALGGVQPSGSLKCITKPKESESIPLRPFGVGRYFHSWGKKQAKRYQSEGEMIKWMKKKVEGGDRNTGNEGRFD